MVASPKRKSEPVRHRARRTTPLHFAHFYVMHITVAHVLRVRAYVRTYVRTRTYVVLNIT